MLKIKIVLAACAVVCAAVTVANAYDIRPGNGSSFVTISPAPAPDTSSYAMGQPKVAAPKKSTRQRP